MNSYRPLIPHLLFCFIIWVVYSKLPALEVQTIQKSTYLTLIGVIKYLPIFLFSSYFSHKISTTLTKKNVIQILLLVYIISAGILKLLPSDISVLGTLILVSLFSLIYEPVFDTIKATIANKTQDFFSVNALSSLMRTSMRFLAPLIVVVPIIDVNISSNFSTFVFAFFAAFLIIFSFLLPRFEVEMKGEDISYVESFKSILRNPLCRYLLLIYSIFYLSVNYLEYFALLLPPNEVDQVGFYYSALGLGFMASNLFILKFKSLIKNEAEVLKFTLVLTGLSLISLSFVGKDFHLIFIFMMGVGNGLSVPVATTIMQKNLKLSELSMLSGVVDTVTNFCAILSIGIGWLLLEFFTVSAVFLVDGIIIVSGAIYWHVVVQKDLK